MNYFELHIGDLTEATAHLTMLEDGAYGRLLRKYYATEKPLPADIKQVQRLVGARSKDEREAVESVLREFFTLEDDGWHQSRCDAEIAAFHDKQVGKEGKRESAKERQRRARERRASLFEQLRSHGQVPPWTTTTADLEAMLSRVTAGNQSPPVTQPVTRDDTATQTPDTRHQSPDSRSKGVEDPPPPPHAPAHTPTRAGQAVMRMKQAGLTAGISPSHPKLLALLEAGITDDELADAAADAVSKGKPFAYALATAEGRRRDAATTGALPAAQAPGRRSAVDRQIATMNALTGKDRSHGPAPAADPANVVDVDARVVP